MQHFFPVITHSIGRSRSNGRSILSVAPRVVANNHKLNIRSPNGLLHAQLEKSNSRYRSTQKIHPVALLRDGVVIMTSNNH